MKWTPRGMLPSGRARGILWWIAAAPMIVVPIINDGSRLLVVVGAMFLIVGLASLRRSDSQRPT